MDVREIVRRVFGRENRSTTYVCIRCGDEFDRAHHDCPSCGYPYIGPSEE